MEKLIPKYALVSFDHDGYTAVIDTNKFQSQTEVNKSQKAKIKTSGHIYSVEILELSDSQEELNAYDEVWSKTQRADAILNEKIKQINSKGKKYGGYLEIWPDDGDSQSQMESEDSHNEVEHVEIINTEIKGSKQRKVTVFFQGTGDYSKKFSKPNRIPFFIDGLSNDQVDLIHLQVQEHRKGVSSFGVQTEKVIVIENELECKKVVDEISKNVRMEDRGISTDKIKKKDKSIETHSNYEANLAIRKVDISRVERKLDEVLGILKHRNSVNCSSIDFLNLDVGMDAQDDVSFPSISPSTMFNQLNSITAKDPVNAIKPKSSRSKLPTINFDSGIFSSANDSPTTEVQVTSDEDRSRNLTSTLDSQIAHPADLGLVSSSSQPPKDFFTNGCIPNANLLEIESYTDMKEGENAEYRIKPQLMWEAKERSCSIGNFGWIIAQNIYCDEEMEGRNYKGNKGKLGLSPRRKHALEHAVIDMYGKNKEQLKQCIHAINSGMRQKFLKRKRKTLFNI